MPPVILPPMGAARSRLAAAVAACVLPALLAAGCGDGSSSTSADPSSPSSSPTGSSVTPSADPSTSPTADEHAVDRPGPFQAPLHTADILIFRSHPLSERMVRRIRNIQGVTATERFSLAQVSIEDHAINVAAVDPATYRNFNTDPITSNRVVAQFQPEWDRIAGGEMALRPSFRKQVARSGYVQLGGRSDAPRIHVGAYSPQIPQIDAVVNNTWIKTLGMRTGNALLVSTGIRTPLSIRKPIQRIVGHTASVQRLDVAARLGLDPQAVQTAFLVGSAADAVG